jgi:primosomal protein N' (replication factor Y)
LGYVVKTSKRTDIQHTKSILELIDDYPLLDKNMLLLTKEISDYYGCSWGEAIEAALPMALRKGRKIPDIKGNKNIQQKGKQDIILIHDIEGKARWNIYLKSIKETLDSNKSVILLLSDISYILKVKEIIETNLNISPQILYRRQPKEQEVWLKIKKGAFDIVIGSRSAIFAPVDNLGLVIIDNEEAPVYKQDQVPHYHARDVAFMRINIEKAKLILGSSFLSLESFYGVKKGKTKYISLPRVRNSPEVKIIDTQSRQYGPKPRNVILSRYLQDCIIQTLNTRGKILLFLNRRGFATFISCRNCGTVLKCPRCNINLVYHFKDNILNCRYCNFKMSAQKICPICNSGYIRYLGAGTEKIESELARIFPQARIKRLNNLKDVDMKNTDIFIATQSIIKEKDYNFDLIGVLAIDNYLNRIDFRSAEKTFGLLFSLLALTEKKVLIETRLPKHYCFQAIENKDIDKFYNKELEYRKQLMFPPYQHLCLVKLRGKKENRVKEISNILFDNLSKYNRNNKTVRVISVNPGQPEKLRGNFYWQILIKGKSAYKIVKFLKLHLKNFHHSGIIVTIDMDPL